MWDDNHWPEYYWDDNHWPGVVVVVVRRVIKWYERIRPRISWTMRGTPCQ